MSSSDPSGPLVKRDEMDRPRAVPKRITAGKHKRSGSNAPKSRPAFVEKLWSMVNDPKNSENIQWMPDGESFQVTNRENFEREVLPIYFKHSNFSSFVRQLNMYGWHKVQDVTSGAMQSGDETWKFQSPNFVRDREDLLDNIVRNRGGKGEDEDDEVSLTHIVRELTAIKENQALIGSDLLRLKEDNQLLWRENIQQRERHKRYSDTLDRILRFLASLYGQNRFLSDVMSPNSNKNQKLIMQNPDSEKTQISELPDGNPLEDILDLSNIPLSPGTQQKISSIASTPSSHVEEQTNVTDPTANNSGNGKNTQEPAEILSSTQNNELIPLESSQSPRQFFPELTYNPNGQLSGGRSESADVGVDDEDEHYEQHLKTHQSVTDRLAKNLDSQGSSIQELEDILQRHVPAYTSVKSDGGDNGALNYDDFLVDSSDAQYAADDFAEGENPIVERTDDASLNDSTKRRRVG